MSATITITSTVLTSIEDPSNTEPVGVNVIGTGDLSTLIVRDIAYEALTAHFGSHELAAEYKVNAVPLLREFAEDTVTIFSVEKR